MNTVTSQDSRTAPVKATWICLAIAWLLFLIPIPGAGLFVGWPLNLVAFILAIVVMARGKTVGGLLPLLASIIVSPIVYFIGLAIFGAAAISGSGGYQDYVERAKAAQESASASAVEAPAGLDLKPLPLEITAAKLFADYEANEVAADDKYKGNQLAVSGTVAGISKDFTDEAYVEIRTPNDFASIHARGLDPSVAAGLSKGQQIAVVCVGGGLMLSSPILNECQVR
ncbi:tRNA_anti-like [Pseudoxanthomonas wuyuanensis]|uniref:tRNA_anti-like n=2 Tax=Pseudoxanthomonas wuyuanensis TaxID=1073196 RepID=A0A286D4S3_9GAMM|nr:OB-fold putative lipoprotein [Pseudoxanthomonas wuyuanensis]SOD53643.1 tRNA_anti-like [Pseudoxanthomonas wuyuanensis]